MRETTIDKIGWTFQLAAYQFGAKVHPAVVRKNGGYQIRVETKRVSSGTQETVSWDYFELDDTGLITKSPRGYASEFNRKVRVTDIDQAVADHAKLAEGAAL
jgi:hypothetical protein